METDIVTGLVVDFTRRAVYDEPGARTYLSPHYRTKVGDLRRTLGLRRGLDSFTVDSVTDLGIPPPPPMSLAPPVERRTAAVVALRYGDRYVRVQLTLERTAGRWQIVGIDPMR